MIDQPDTAARILAAVENALGDQLTPTAHAEALDSIRRILADQPAPAPLTLPRDQVAAVRDICNRLLGTAPAAVAPSPKAPQSQDAELTRLRTELAALRQVARGYCPECGRGDCAPTVHDWERQRQRAEQAEAERDELRGEITTALARLADMAKSRAEQDGAELVRLRERAEQAEAAIARVRALHRPVEGLGYGPDDDDTPGAYGDIAQVCSSCGTSGEHGVRWPCPTIAALNPPKETQP